VEAKITELKSAMSGENVQQIRSLIGELQQTTMSIGQSLYQNTNGGTAGPQSDQPRPEGPDVVEGEYRQV